MPALVTIVPLPSPAQSLGMAGANTYRVKEPHRQTQVDTHGDLSRTWDR